MTKFLEMSDPERVTLTPGDDARIQADTWERHAKAARIRRDTRGWSIACAIAKQFRTRSLRLECGLS